MSDLIKSTTGRNLNPKQHAKLDRMGSNTSEAEAVVTGWSQSFLGPIIRMPDGEMKVLPPTGYLRQMPADKL